MAQQLQNVILSFSDLYTIHTLLKKMTYDPLQYLVIFFFFEQ